VGLGGRVARWQRGRHASFDAGVPRALLLLDSLRAQGIRLSDDDGDSLVRVSLTRFDDGALERVRDRLEAAGLVQGFNEIIWGLPPDRR
jgi:hypothetical protein